MSKHKKYSHHSMQQQQGAVAIIVEICLTLLVGMLGLVLDLGHLYIAKTELQNAADSASLSGAKELNGRVSGITSAANRAIEVADNISACLTGATGCIALVRVSIINASYVPMVGLFPFLAVPIPASTVTMPAESLGYTGS